MSSFIAINSQRGAGGEDKNTLVFISLAKSHHISLEANRKKKKYLPSIPTPSLSNSLARPPVLDYCHSPCLSMSSVTLSPSCTRLPEEPLDNILPAAPPRASKESLPFN